MANVFTRTNESTPTPNRNTFDGSFVNNLTLKMGQITPCFLKEVIPGDSFKIDATFGFNFQPMVFPVQTGMQANLHFFYVRNRALWRGWQNFITKTDNKDNDTVPPFIYLTENNREMFETGKIGDYLGVPTTFYSTESLYQPFDNMSWWPSNGSQTGVVYAYNYDYTYHNGLSTVAPPAGQLISLLEEVVPSLQSKTKLLPLQATTVEDNLHYYQRGSLPYGVGSIYFNRDTMKANVLSIYNKTFSGNFSSSSYESLGLDPQVYTITPWCAYVVVGRETGKIYSTWYYNYETTNDYVEGGAFHSTNGNAILEVPSDVACDVIFLTNLVITTTDAGSNNGKIGRTFSDELAWRIFYNLNSVDGLENSQRQLSDLPFASSGNPKGLRISALPFRAVEACYNSFYRDPRNNPLRVNGKELYNTWILNDKGGADTSLYKLYQRNWQDDVFTTAVQSPQQGIAPLVGVTASGQMTFQDEEGKTYYLQAEFGEDGHTITGIKSYSSDMPVGTLRAMVDTISTGISINDFRNVNSLQRWLETNMRKGLRYKDQLEAHFGVAPTYSELDMPEFIGGMSRDVSMSKVVQTSQSVDGHPLGTLAGSASVLGDAGQSVTKFVDEHGWIIGFITISPVPVYSQQLNKQLLKTELLDYYFPEFAHIGYQPILNQEIAPLQCRDEAGKKLQDVFGYQRAWYEYLSSQDEVHGDFRTTMRDYLINRVFADVPQLGVDFLTISTREANDVFAVEDDDSDKIFGQIYFNVSMKRPIPAIGTPKLEVG